MTLFLVGFILGVIGLSLGTFRFGYSKGREHNEDNIDEFIRTLTYYQKIQLIMNFNTLFYGYDNDKAYEEALMSCDDDDVRYALEWLMNMDNLKG